jgi:hypothetical protein
VLRADGLEARPVATAHRDRILPVFMGLGPAYIVGNGRSNLADTRRLPRLKFLVWRLRRSGVLG